MAAEFTPLNENDTKELRKALGLPVTKGLVYWLQERPGCWKQLSVADYEIAAVYEPSGSRSVRITLEDGRQVRILGDFLADMQKPSFLSDVGGKTEKQQGIAGKCGRRIEDTPNTYTVVDLETTGTNHWKDEITEIGAIRYEDGIETERLQLLVKTEVKIPKSVEKLNGITNDMLRLLGCEPKDAYEELRKFLGDSIVLGHNFTSFDSKFLEDAYVRELGCHFPNDYIDTLYLARKMRPELEHHSLEALSQEYGIDYSKAHRAAEDCQINQRIYEQLIGRENETEELVASAASEEWQVKLSAKFAELETELGLVKDSLSIMENARKNKKVSSYAICVYEPDLVEDRKDSSRNTVLARVREAVLKSNDRMVDLYSKSFEPAEEKKRFDKDSEEFLDCLITCIRSGIQAYVPKAAGFACCSRYQECSDAKKCVHPNGLYAKACQYRKNLEEGTIFY